MSLRFSSVNQLRPTLYPTKAARSRITQRYITTASLSKDTPLTLHLGESTAVIPFSADEAKNLGRSFNALLQTFKDKQSPDAPKKFDIMQYSFKDPEPSVDSVHFLEVMCNPNAFPSAFEAKLFISLKSQNGISFQGESHLSQLKSDLQAYIQEHVTAK